MVRKKWRTSSQLLHTTKLAVAGLACALALGLSGCNNDLKRYFKSGEVGWALKKEIRDRQAPQIKLVQLTKFEWDEFFLFGPYQPTSEICRYLELSIRDCKSTINTESTDDSEMLMVFRLKKKIVHTEMHIRWNGDFTPVPDEPLTPQTAIFSVTANGQDALGEPWLQLRLQPL